MPNDPGTALTPRREFEIQLDQQAQNFRALLPSHISVEKFKRVVVVAVSQNPDLFHADRRSFFNAAQKCAVDGLLPDGRQAALVVYNTKVKTRLQDGTYDERWVPAVQYMPMIAGVRQRMRNSGEVLSAEAHVVYRNDKFFQKFGDDPAIVHEPPAVGTDRGEPVGAYAIIKLKNGEILREVMDRQQIDRVRAVSKSKDGPAWKGWWDEMARKTVMRRCAKAAPNSADIDSVLARDDEPPEIPSLVELPGREPEPQRQIAASRDEDEDEAEYVAYLIVDMDGEEHEFATVGGAARALRAVLDDAKRRGRAAVEAAVENNAAAIADIREHAPELWRDTIDPFWLPPLATEPQGSPPAHAAPAPSAGPAKPEHPHSAPQDGSAPASPAGGRSHHQPANQERATSGEPDGTRSPNHSDQPPAGETDLLGDTPAEDLRVPLERNPSIQALEFFARQLVAMLDEKPRTAQRTAHIRGENEYGIQQLKKVLPDTYDTVQAELARKS